MHAVVEGKRPLPTSDAERHHYVAQFQLTKFRGKGRLYQLDKEDGSCEVVTPKKAAWSSNLYTVESTTGEHNGIVEGFFSVAEGFAAPALKKFLADPSALSDRDRGDLAFLVAIQEQRVPGFLAEQKEAVTHAGITYLATQLANTEGPKGEKRKAMEAYEALTDGSVRIEPPDQEVLTLSLNMLAEVSQLVNALPWTFLRATEGAFICSDRPLTMHDPTPPYRWSAPGWLSSPMVEATMPLGRSSCLRISPAQHQRIAVRPTTKQVERINRRSYGFATRFVYGPTSKVLEDLHALAQCDPNSIPKPIKKQMVIFEDPETADPKIADGRTDRMLGAICRRPRATSDPDDPEVREVSLRVGSQATMKRNPPSTIQRPVHDSRSHDHERRQVAHSRQRGRAAQTGRRMRRLQATHPDRRNRRPARLCSRSS